MSDTSSDNDTLASIPDEAVFCLMPHNTERTSPTASFDPVLIPRADILGQIVKLICSEEEISSSPNGVRLLNSKLTLRGMGGLGKTTLAAIAVSLKDLRSAFDCILWLNLGSYFKGGTTNRNNLDYDMYLDCLRNLCCQLNLSADKFLQCGEAFIQPGDNKVMKGVKIMQAMERSKNEMCRMLDGLKVLIVLDDVWSHDDVELFNFGERMSTSFSILLTTRMLDQDPSVDSTSIKSSCLDVDLLTADQAIYLFFVEAGFSCSVDKDSEIINRIIKKCGYLPLSVRMAGRLIKSHKTVNDGAEMSMREIAEIVFSATDSPSTAPVIDILDCSFSFIKDKAAASEMKLLFSAFTVVFQRDDALRPWVGLSSLTLLMMALQGSDEMKQLRLPFGRFKCDSNKVLDIANLMFSMGIFDKKLVKKNQDEQEYYFRTHHDLMCDYGKMLYSKVIQTGQLCAAPVPLGFSVLNYVTERWNRMIVVHFISEVQSKEYMKHDAYYVDWLPLNMINAGLLEEASNMLKNENFITERMKAVGIVGGTHSFILFLRSFEKKFHSQGTNAVHSSLQKSPVPIFISFLKDYLCGFNSLEHLGDYVRTDIGRALILLGAEVQKFSKWSESLDYFTEASDIFCSTHYGSCHPDIDQVMKHIDSCVIQNIILVHQDSPHKLRLKHVDDILNGVQSKNSVSLELSSHPGYAIVRMNDKLKTLDMPGLMSYKFAAIGVGLKDSAMCGTFDGTFIKNVPDNWLLYATYGALGEGDPVAFGSDFCSEGKEKSIEQEFRIDSYGSVYPKRAPHLCLGIAPYPVLNLVARNSPNRAVLKNSSELLQSKQKQEPEIKITSSNCVDTLIHLELLSHPDMAIVHMFKKLLNISFLGNIECGLLGLGPVKNALTVKLTGKNHIVVTNKHIETGFCIPNDTDTIGSDEGDLVGVCSAACYSNFPGFVCEFSINCDGTISPLGSEHLALGFLVPGVKRN